MIRKAVVFLGAFGLALAIPLFAQTTQPAGGSATALELRANELFDKGDYAGALPIYMKVANLTRTDVTRGGAIQERIRVCQRNLTPVVAADGAVAPAAKVEAPASQPASEARKPHVRPKDGEFLDLLIKDLGNFEFDADKGGNIPKDVTALNGAKIRTRGFMIPLDQAENISQFALVPSLFACCFGQPPQVQHTLVVHAPKGKAVSYFADEITVEGTLKVEEKREDGFIVSVFEIDCTSVKPAPK